MPRASGKRNVSMIKIVVLALLIGTSTVAFFRFAMPSSTKDEFKYRTVPVKRQSISNTISATGTIEPCDIIDVGAQVAARVIEFGIDPDTKKQLDYGSRVT